MTNQAFLQARDLLLRHREDYATAVDSFHWPQPTEFNWALDWFDAHLAAGERGNRTALKIVGSDAATRTFRELSEQSSRVANGLRELGVKRGDRVLMMLGNCAALWELMLACMKLGAVTIPATTLLTADDLAERVRLGGVRFWITDAELAEKFQDLDLPVTRVVVGDRKSGWISYADLAAGAAEFRPDGVTRADDPLLLYFTSGTTSKPKLVSHTHASYPIGALSTMYWLGLRPGDVHMNVSAPGWAKHAWSCFFAPWNAEATVFIANIGRFNALTLLQAMTQNGVTSMCAPPTVWRMLVQEDLAPHRGVLNNLCGAGEPLNPEVMDAVARAWGLQIRDGFGQTETTCVIGNSPGQRIKPGSVGRPLPGYEVMLLDPEGNSADEGEISLRLNPAPTGLMRGYQDETGTVRKLEGAVYRTGDIASRDSDGYITYVGRADDVFKSSDYRISPFELESALIEHALIVEAAVVPAPDAMRLALPKAYIVLAAGAESNREMALSVFRHIQKVLAPYKRVRRIEFTALPKTISGKIRRVELRRLEVERARVGERSAGEFREEDFPELRD
ncbi:AMP-binding protein [Steroidobacter cummioxidans]|uniref:AMP-binding protein n=1 Tax=Steroidobacter cummioxidans TaxID=1803913 RepID=UPI000E324D77|nr:AMP-binding protein [Steroidobacter cummioxidans]